MEFRIEKLMVYKLRFHEEKRQGYSNSTHTFISLSLPPCFYCYETNLHKINLAYFFLYKKENRKKNASGALFFFFFKKDRAFLCDDLILL